MPPAGRWPPPLPGHHLPFPSLPLPSLPGDSGGLPVAGIAAPVSKPPSVSGRIWMFWGLVAVCVALIMSARADSSGPNGAVAEQKEVQLTLVSRYTVGCKLLFGAQFTSKTTLDDMARQVEQAAQGGADYVRIVPVIAELKGNEEGGLAAASALVHLDDTPKNKQLRADAALLQKSYEHNLALPLARQREIEKRYGWFGSLAAWQLNGDQKAHAQVISSARLTVIVILSLLIGGGLFLLTSIVLAIVFLVRWSSGEMPPRFVLGDPSVADAFVEGFAIYLAGFVVMILGLPHVLPEHASFAWNVLIVVPFAAAIGWIRYRGVTWEQFVRQTGLHRGRGVVREMFAGIVGYISGLPLLIAGAIACTILSKMSHVTPTHPIEKNILDPGWTRFWLYVLACVYAPITEELLFRGMLFRHLSLRVQWFVSMLIVSLIFAAIHPQGWTAIPILGAIALVLALIRYQRDSIVGSMTAHALNNFLALTIVILAAG
jgi:membrane protease YdiL (CAAX protease family)